MTSIKLIACKYCGNLIRPCNITKHESRHENNPKSFKDYSFKLNHEGLDCQFCGKTCKNRNSLCNHERLCKENPNKQESYLSNQGWSKGLTKETDVRIARYSQSRKASGKPGTFTGKKHTEESKRKIAEAQLLVDHDAHNKYSHGKRGYLDNMFFMSTWELIYYIYMRDHGHKIIRCPYKYLYEDKGKKHRYTPDFLVDDTYIVEVKGRETKLDLLKYSLVENLKIVYEPEIKEYNNYIREHYNTDLPETLYDVFLEKQ